MTGTPPTAPSLGGTRFAVVDVETSGLRAERHRLLQVAVVRADATGQVLDQWVTFVRPGLHRLGPREIHGLDRRTLRGAPRFADVVPDLVARLDGAVVVAHNLGFDWAFLSRGLARAGYPTPDAERLCTLRLSRSTDPDRTRGHRLADLTRRYDVPLVRAHDAEADARATAALLPHLLAEAGITDLDGLAPHVQGTTRTWPTVSGPVRRAWLPGWWPSGTASVGAGRQR